MILNKILKYDAIQEAEDCVNGMEGSDKFDSDLRNNLILSYSLENHIKATELKNELLISLGDTHMGMTMTRYITILSQIGFKVIYSRPFLYEKYVEKEIVLFDYERSILLYTNTYNEERVNSAHMYYNLVLKEGCKHYSNTRATSNGTFIKQPYLPSAEMCNRLYPRMIQSDYIWPVWVGSHDAREGVLFHLEEISKEFDFLPYWFERPHLWLVNHAETDSKRHEKRPNYDEITNSKIKLLDNLVKDKISGIKFKIPRLYRKSRHHYRYSDDYD